MSIHLYWLSAITYAIVLIIILVNDLYMRRKTNKVEKDYRLLMSWSIFFCLQDCLWGLCNSGVLENDFLFYTSSAIFHISVVTTTFFWLYFVVAYEGESFKRRFLYLHSSILIALVEIGLVIYNSFNPILFEIHDGRYYIGEYRWMTFSNQFIVYLFIAIVAGVTLLSERKNKDTTRYDSHLTVFLAALAPIVLGICQYYYADLPFYSIGIFMSLFIVHIFVVAKERVKIEQSDLFKSISDTYYSLHLIDFELNSVTHYIESPILKNIFTSIKDPQMMLNRAMCGTAKEEYADALLKFVDLRTLSKRMKDRNRIDMEFVGKNYGWTRIFFISVEKKEQELKKVMVATQVIDNEKRKQMELIFKTVIDELTGLNNRRAYDNELIDLQKRDIPDDLVLIAIDVNRLKHTNDTLGHEAGDELLIGAADCMKKCFSRYGKLFRTGGDEFCAILRIQPEQLYIVKEAFKNSINNWKGVLVEQLAASCGYVMASDFAHPTIHEMSILADERMYQDKTLYYKQLGIDRSGNQKAHIAICSLYSTILKINLTTDKYETIQSTQGESESQQQNSKISECDFGWTNQCSSQPTNGSVSQWLSDFGWSAKIHPDDLENYLSRTNMTYLKDYFTRRSTLTLMYRRNTGSDYKPSMIEIIPANDYNTNNQSLYLYVRHFEGR